MHEYFCKKFPAELQKLEFLPAPAHLSKLYDLDGAVFFGGPGWSNVEKDLAAIPSGTRTQFILSLFMVVLTDQALFTWHPEAYRKWRDATPFRKFGYFGFGIHNENPCKLLEAPVTAGMEKIDTLTAAMPEFVQFLISESATVLSRYGANIDAHLSAIMAACSTNSSPIVKVFTGELKRQFGTRQTTI